MEWYFPFLCLCFWFLIGWLVLWHGTGWWCKFHLTPHLLIQSYQDLCDILFRFHDVIGRTICWMSFFPFFICFFGIRYYRGVFFLLQYLFCYLHSVTLWEGSQALHENQIDGVGFPFLIHIFFCLLFIRLRFFHHKWCIRVYFFFWLLFIIFLVFSWSMGFLLMLWD